MSTQNSEFHIVRTGKSRFLPKFSRKFNTSPCTGDLGKEVTSQIDCLIHSVYMYKPFWGPINREKI